MSYYLQLLNDKGINLTTSAKSVRIASGLAVDLADVIDTASLMDDIQWDGGRKGANRIIALTTDGFRICSECKVPKSRGQYTRNKNKLDGLDARCRECKSAIAKRRREAKKAA